ncbi:hypothetical protein NT6N_04760 [Oceaniferula spumae]|uniref:Long-chain-fatty-acyl-CoA reductase n=1 Tax=Oceaniferula spumae TaxID=2979115 RepID=A0AAT9FHG7_9BACT
MTTSDRIKLLANACQTDVGVELLGPVTADMLTDWLAEELGNADVLDQFSPHGELMSRAYAPEVILHIVSGNTPHAALQSLLRGLLLGSFNIVKLPTSGLPEIINWIESLPHELRQLVECHNNLTEHQWQQSNAVVAIGSDETMAEIHGRLRPDQLFIPHGHKVSIGIVTDDFENAARLAAKDVSLYNQRGCLSPHAIYVSGDARRFAELLASEMQKFNDTSPADPLSLSEAGAVVNLRETTRFLAANEPSTALWHSQDDLAWAVIFEENPELKLSCLNRCVYVKSLPSEFSLSVLGEEANHLSTIAIHPFTLDYAETLCSLPAHRICPLGKSQEPNLFWHHDGFAPLASLVKWKDLG